MVLLRELSRTKDLRIGNLHAAIDQTQPNGSIDDDRLLGNAMALPEGVSVKEYVPTYQPRLEGEE